MNKVKIFLDMDHVLYDWDKGALNLIGLDTNDPVVRSILKTEYTIAKDFSYPREEFDVLVDDMRESFWSNLELYPWSKKLYSEMNNISDVVFLTSPGSFTHAYGGKLSAIKRDFNSESIILTRHKHYCADSNSILIDDSIKNIDDFKMHGGHTFRWPNAYYLIDGGEQLWNQYIDQCLEYVTLKMKIND